MSSSGSGKVDPAVFRELDRLAEGGGDPRVPVVIEHVLPAHQLGGGAGTADTVDAAALEEQVRRLQRGIVEWLEHRGVPGVRGMMLANAVTATLARSQVVELARHPDVRRIHLSRPERVTTRG